MSYGRKKSERASLSPSDSLKAASPVFLLAALVCALYVSYGMFEIFTGESGLEAFGLIVSLWALVPFYAGMVLAIAFHSVDRTGEFIGWGLLAINTWFTHGVYVVSIDPLMLIARLTGPFFHFGGLLVILAIFGRLLSKDKGAG